MSWLGRVAVLAALALFAAPREAHALAKFTITTTTGGAFSDATPTLPVGGNPGRTLGAQRRLAVERALEIWGSALDSAVPIVVETSFKDLSCSRSSAVLAQAFPEKLYANLPGTSGQWYPSPLADRLAGRDLSPGDPDLSIDFNLALDGPCRADAGGWYYGFDMAPPGQNGLVTTALHELAHGFGFSSWVSVATGALFVPGQLDVFSSHVFDLDLGKSWAELSEAQRVLSATNVRHVVWNGPAAQRAAQDFLEPGVPSLTLEPALVGFRGWVGDATGALNAAQHPVRGKVVLAQPANGCSALPSDAKAAVVLMQLSASCSWSSAAGNAAAAGAAAALFVVGSPAQEPPRPLDAVDETVALPVATISVDDAILLSDALRAGREVVAQLAGQQTRLLGADERGRPLLFSPKPVQRGSSISHFDVLSRPNLLLEPYSNLEEPLTIDPVTLGVMHDIGWTTSCGNGRVDSDERCDEGRANADRVGARCRTTCQLAGCGDGILDLSELCDDGKANSDVTPDACRTSCVRARCGDAVVDNGEACDTGSANSDTLPNACRSTCVSARCGDAIVDMNEGCDQGASNDDARPNSCRKNCLPARCGDGVVDDAEECDGSPNCSPACTFVVRAGDAATRTNDPTRPGEPPDATGDDAPAWVDPWDAPSTDKPKAKRSGCAIGVATSTASPPLGLCSLLTLALALARLRRDGSRHAGRRRPR